ncbi:MAG: hypothetical protein P4L46_03285 [Fimbriimonas sp.]|nr:hypothetical protein [Fimbriimonas sp.]
MRRTLTAAAIIATLGVCGVANAQTNNLDTSPNNITIRGGVALPADTSLNNVSNSFIDLGIDYQFGNSLFKGGETYLSVDAFFNDLKNVIAWPAAINQRFYMGQNAQGHRNYFFLGIGMTWVNVTTSGSGVSARGGLGTELGPNIIAELTGYIADQTKGVRANAVTFDIGYRF